MFKVSNKQVVLLLLFAFSFIYRIVLMLWETYPSGADIGLHSSVIYSITQSGHTNFLNDFYQMGGGLSLTFPGYHIFTSGIILMTGMSDYLAQAFVVSLFSSLIVLCAYLVTRAAWTESAALIVAFIVAVSRFDIEMLMWGGYPNVITLFLIPLTFYLYLQRSRFSLAPFLISTSILIGSIFLTHSLSAVIFVGVTVATVLVVMVFPHLFGASRKNVFSWLLPIVFGAVLVSPFLASAVPAYLSANSTFTGLTDIQRALLSTKLIPLDVVLPLFVCVTLFFFLSKYYRGRFFSVPAFLLAMWLLVPLVLTQGYLFGLYIDYNRFLYFLLLPAIILFGVFLDHGAAFFAGAADTFRVLSSQMQKTKKTTNKYLTRISKYLTRKNLYGGFIVSFLLVAFFAFPVLATPWGGVAIGSFYQVMNNPGYEAIQWAKQNTPVNSVFVSDALYGWWLGGFSQRPTLSAVDPEYLTVARELNPAKNASLLLDTDFMVDNGYIQIREDGGYIARHNPEILAELNWTYFPYSFFDFDSDQMRVDYTVNGISQYTYLDQLSVKAMSMESNSQSATIIVSRGNSLLNYTQYTTVYPGSPFINLTSTVDSTVNGVFLNYITYNVQSKGTIIELNNSTVGWIDLGLKVFGQLIFYGNQSYVSESIGNPPPYDVTVQYSLDGKSQSVIQMAAGAYSVTDDPQYYNDQAAINNYFEPIITANLNQPQPIGNLPVKPLITFDYQTAIQQYSVSYIANRDSGLNPKFAFDPTFNLVFINSEVAIFKVKANATLTG